MKHVVSVSLGSSKRATYIETELLGQSLLIERRATDGNIERAKELVRELDGKVDAIGLGGIDLYIYAGSKRYVIRDARKIADEAKKTPVVCGAGLKDSLERHVVETLGKTVDWSNKRVLMVSAVDRFGMAEALHEEGARIIYGDMVFSLGLPVPIRSISTTRALARLLLPIATRLPFTWLYPTGSKQEAVKEDWRSRYYHEVDVIAGDFLWIKRSLPNRFSGKTILTNTTTAEDIEDLRRRGVKTLITTTPRYGSRSLSTNLLEAAFFAIADKFPLSREDYTALIEEAGLEPDVLELNPSF
ncbi:hypothetical protein BH24DEI1_BH24DEI1_06390 [soil metagenome]